MICAMYSPLRCDLLENSYFYSIANNSTAGTAASRAVVICLKTRTFAVSQTTWAVLTPCAIMLWFAWKLVLLQYRKQLSGRPVVGSMGCDLLENSYFCSIANNSASYFLGSTCVVICLKTRTFAVSQTTTRTYKLVQLKLWFAWKLVLLQYRKQPFHEILNVFLSCDLLENSYFCSIANNKSTEIVHLSVVVICLKTRTFAVSQTTQTGCWNYHSSLWFAWKLVLLQYRKQQQRIGIPKSNCCDLLENSYFCSIANNALLYATTKQTVVICLKTRTFAVSQTTKDNKALFNL